VSIRSISAKQFQVPSSMFQMNQQVLGPPNLELGTWNLELA
jgi:hypothetical protein